MKNFSTAVIFAAIFSLFSIEAKAQVKIAPSNWATEATNWIAKTSEDVNTAIEPVAEEYQTMKKGIKNKKQSAEIIKRSKEKYEEFQKKKAAAEKLYSDVNKTVSEGQNLVGEVQGNVQKATQKTTQGINKAQELYDQANNNVLKLKEELKASQQEYNDYLTQETAKLNARKKILLDNNATLATMLEREDTDGSLQRIEIEQNQARQRD